jgi:exonuclease III
VRLLTWNLNARRNVDGQVAAIAAHQPDVVALQEVTARTVSVLRTTLPALNLSHVIDSFAASPEWVAVGPRRYGLLIASRFPLSEAPHAHEVVWPERLLSARVSTPTQAVVIHSTHIPPGSSNGGTSVGSSSVDRAASGGGLITSFVHARSASSDASICTACGRIASAITQRWSWTSTSEPRF